MLTHAITSWQDAARPGAHVGHLVEVHDSIGSTNDRVRELLEADAPAGMAVVAELQTAGRGRMGRSWTSPAGRNLTVSIGLKPDLAAADAWQIGLAAALAVHGTAARHARVGLKWPNDLVSPDGLKVAGMLVEAASEGEAMHYAILGFGINVNWDPGEMPAELASTATSLAALAGQPIDRVALLRALLEAVEDEIVAIEGGRSPMTRYRDACVTLGTRVSVDLPHGRVTGLAVDLDGHGALLVRTDDGREVAVTSGEVTRLRPEDGR